MVTAAFHSLWTDWESGRGTEVFPASGAQFLFMDFPPEIVGDRSIFVGQRTS